jgi:hypothetical protein
MHIGREQLEALFRGMSDEELLDRCDADLTELARDVALAEAAKRGLTLPTRAAIDEVQGGEIAQGHGPLRICATFMNPLVAEALIVRLLAEGFAAQTHHANGGVMGSVGLAGVRVMVPESQLEDAKRIREAFDAGDYAIDEDFDVNQ